MTKKEIDYIKEQIAKNAKWAEEERVIAMNSDDKEIKADHYLQARLCDCAASTLENLLSELCVSVEVLEELADNRP